MMNKERDIRILEVALICNDEGKLQGLPLNRGLRDERGELYDIICLPLEETEG